MEKLSIRGAGFGSRWVLAMLIAAGAVFPVQAQFGARFTAQDVLGTDGGAAGSSGGTIYPYPNPYVPQTLAPLPEITGDYSVHYLYSPATGQTYADPMFYHGQSALARWDAIQASGRRMGIGAGARRRPVVQQRVTRETITEEKSETTRRSAAPMPSLQEIIDK